jgi:hypothetical protein
MDGTGSGSCPVTDLLKAVLKLRVLLQLLAQTYYYVCGKNNPSFREWVDHHLWHAQCVMGRKLGFIHRNSISWHKWRRNRPRKLASAVRVRPGTVYFLSGNKGKRSKHKQGNCFVLWSHEFRIPVMSVKCVTADCRIWHGAWEVDDWFVSTYWSSFNCRGSRSALWKCGTLERL